MEEMLAGDWVICTKTLYMFSGANLVFLEGKEYQIQERYLETMALIDEEGDSHIVDGEWAKCFIKSGTEIKKQLTLYYDNNTLKIDYSENNKEFYIELEKDGIYSYFTLLPEDTKKLIKFLQKK